MSTAVHERTDTMSSAATATLPHILLEGAGKHPQLTLVRQKRFGIWEPRTWAEVADDVRSVALGLATLFEIARCDVVVVIGENGREQVTTELAVQALGASVLLAYPDCTDEELAGLVSRSGAALLVAHDQEQVDKVTACVRSAVRGIVYIDERGLWDYDHEALTPLEAVRSRGRAAHQADSKHFDRLVEHVGVDDIAMLVVTNGDESRLVPVTHREVIERAERIIDGCGLRPGSDYLSANPMAWDVEHTIAVACALTTPLVVNFPEAHAPLEHDLRELGPQVVLLGARQWERLWRRCSSRITGAGRVRTRLFDWAVRRDPPRPVSGAATGGVLRRQQTVSPPRFTEALILRPMRAQLGLGRTIVALSAGTTIAPGAVDFFRRLGVDVRNLYATSDLGPLVLDGPGCAGEARGRFLAGRPDHVRLVRSRLTRAGELEVLASDGRWHRTHDVFASGDDGSLTLLDGGGELPAASNGARLPRRRLEARLRSNAYVRDGLLVDGSGGLGCIIAVDVESVSAWSEANGIAAASTADLLQHPRVLSLLADGIANAFADVPDEHTPRNLLVLPVDLDADELTRHRDPRRAVIERHFAEFFAALDAGPATVDVAVRRGSATPAQYAVTVTPIVRSPRRVVQDG